MKRYVLFMFAALLLFATKDVNAQSDYEIIYVNGVSFKMIKVKGGTFTMGATAEQGDCTYNWNTPAHQVTLSTYYMGETEVTQALWVAVMGNNPSTLTESRNLPVHNVSWHDCQLFIERLNRLTGRYFRLPSEAEWEYAARGGNKSQGYKYAGSNNVDAVAWYKANSLLNCVHNVAQRRPNELGLYDMSGNALEWCSDWAGEYSDAAQTNPRGATSGGLRIMRGGCWAGEPESLRVSVRYNCSPVKRSSIYGLRLAMDW